MNLNGSGHQQNGQKSAIRPGHLNGSGHHHGHACRGAGHAERRAGKHPDNDAAHNSRDDSRKRRGARGDRDAEAQRKRHKEDDEARWQVVVQRVTRRRVDGAGLVSGVS